MNDTMIAVARKAYQAYVNKDRAAIEAVIGDDFHFSSPLDNRLNRKSTLIGVGRTANGLPVLTSSIWCPTASASS
jgi:hypothetical protein